MEFTAIILASGNSERFQGLGNKVFYPLNHKKTLLYSLETFQSFQNCQKIIIVYRNTDENEIQEIINNYHDKRIVYTHGGKYRYQSVLKGLELVNTDYVIVHDGARPNVSSKSIDDCLYYLSDYECVSLALKITDTVKRCQDEKIQTIKRDNLYTVQTPQGCKTTLLKEALRKVKEVDKITDDLEAIEKYTDIVPKLIDGSRTNIKLTTIDDIKLLEYFLGGR